MRIVLPLYGHLGGMAQDFGWDAAAPQYEAAYRRLKSPTTA